MVTDGSTVLFLPLASLAIIS